MASESDPAEVLRSMPFVRALGVEFVSADGEAVRTRLEWSEERCTTAGVMHGGALMALADTTGAMCAFMKLPEDAAGTTTLESKTHFLLAVRSGHVEAVARPLHVGRSVIVVETELRDAEGRLAAKVTQSQMVLRA